uniref:Uncharacterized protein n=1 Tax=Ditylum brightwellii TaxID=49249 RepID=A0A7S2EGG5_9STRA|mmetsp:Transcript_28444/g.42241  ORF Transcript_28444/g.42241 Transcript_28444/m.42241 type:complete len:253 (+) Transcript_28444:147-905(+)
MTSVEVKSLDDRKTIDQASSSRLNLTLPFASPTTLKTLGATFTACAVASAITLPADILITKWRNSALAEWNPELRAMGVGASSRSTFTGTSTSDTINPHSTYISVQKKLRIISPFFRLMSNEIATNALNYAMENSTTSKSPDRSSMTTYFAAGAIAGTAQALVLCPLEAYRAHSLAQEEIQAMSRAGVLSKLQSWFVSTCPTERLNRAYRGIGLYALREMAYNCTFFPLFYSLQNKFKSVMETTKTRQQMNK